MTRNTLLSAGMNVAKCNLSNTKPHLFLLRINRKQMPIRYHMKHYPNRTEREQIHLHLCCVTFYLGFCCCHCCLCCLILLFDFIGLFHNFSHLKLPDKMLSYAEIPFIMHRFCIVTLMNSQTIDYNTAIITCEYVATEISISLTHSPHHTSAANGMQSNSVRQEQMHAYEI